MEDFIRISIEQDIDKCIKIYGIEGMEDKIYSVYQSSPALRDRYLEIFYNKYPFLKKFD